LLTELLREACRREPSEGDGDILPLLDNPERLRFKLEGGASAPESFFCDELEKTEKARVRSWIRKQRRKGGSGSGAN
jgi:hypothetical protein